MKKIFVGIMSMMLAAVLVLGSFAVPASAATKKTVKEQQFATVTKDADKKAVVVKKGTYKLTVKGGQGYIKFVSPKTKTYTFTFSKLKSKNGVCCHISTQEKRPNTPKYLTFVDVKTKGGKVHFLKLGVNGYSSDTGNLSNDYHTSRYAKIKLKKGKAIYFHLSNGTKKTTMQLKIK